MKNLLLSACCLAALAANAEEYSLVGRRYLRLYSAAEATPVYNAETDAQKIVREMCNVPWTRSDETNAVSTSHANESLDDNVANRQRFDAAIFCSHHTDSRHIAHANAACYVYRLPDGSLPNLTSLSATITCDPYNALGARLVLMTSDTPEIPTDCQVVRGESGGGVKLAALAPRITRQMDGKDYWYPNTTNAVFTVPDAPRVAGAGDLPSGGLQLRRYLLLFVLMENYSMSRGNWLEGCAWIENAVSISTDAPVPGWTDGATVNLFDAAENPVQDDGDVSYVDTIGNAISSSDAEAYLLADGYLKDSDNDGLSNFAEYLSSAVLTNVMSTPVVKADRMKTHDASVGGAQVVPDYFLPVGSTYLGAMLTDHDFVEDWLEDSAFFNGERHASRYAHDAQKDYDGNGWDNWSEARSYLLRNHSAPSDSLPNMIPTPTGRIKVVYNDEIYRYRLGNLIIQSYRYRDGNIPPMTVAPDACWELPMTSVSAWYGLDSPSSGAICGGKNMFVVYNDANADGRWTAGEPYGIVTDVEVGYDHIADSTVEITDVNPSMIRIDLQEAMKAQDYATQNALTDRGVNGNGLDSNVQIHSNLFANVGSGSENIFVRIVRVEINGYGKLNNGVLAVQEIATETINPSFVPVLSEWLVLRTGICDLDAHGLKDCATRMGFSSSVIANATYSVLIGDGTLDAVTLDNNNFLSVSFVNSFKNGVNSDKPVAEGVEYAHATHPVFTWSVANESAKAYPAFKLRVKQGATVVKTFGPLPMPAKGKDGCYRWESPLCAGCDLANNTTYSYDVALVDAKFYGAANENDNYSTPKEFTVNVNGLGGGLSDQYSIFAAVKYFGPVSVTANKLRVEAFETPDFAGLPSAVTYAKDVADIASTTSITWNAQLIGLKPDCDYYVRAFIDVNTNGVKDASESWGYGNYVGSDRKDIYTPRAYRMKQGSFKMPMSVVYLEDVSIPPVDIKGIVSTNLIQSVTL